MDVATARTRPPLTRHRVLDAALRYIDAQGLAALSMHKLGADLGVKAMSLYNHVADKDDVLDGVVELLWTEIETAAPATGDWRAGYRAFGHALWDVISGHPNAGPLVCTRQIIPAAALRIIRDHIASATASGVHEQRAYALLRTISSFALGHVLVYLNWSPCSGRAPTVTDLLSSDLPAELVNVAENFCGQSNLQVEFELGLDLMLRGIAFPDGDVTSDVATAQPGHVDDKGPGGDNRRTC
ncbi:MAG TPA: TetR/AcrR family transcriptional regulator [Pseudonocardiaceae bacterium]|jgi:AcrR family transcriptional regulator